MPDIFETADAAASTATAYSLSPGQTAQGRLSTNGDHDWYAVNLVAGQTYTFAMVGTGTAGVANPYLQIYGPGGGSVVASNDNGLPNLNSVVTYTAATTGTYYIDAGSSGNTGTGQYGISVAQGTKAITDVPMGAGIIDAYSVTGNEYAWNASPGTPATVTLGYRLTDDGAEPNFSQFTATQMAAMTTIMQNYMDVCGITFNVVNPGGYTDNATILLSNYNNNDGSGGYAYYPGSTASSAVEGDIHINIAGGNSTSSVPLGSYSYNTLQHELGHALGLSHPGLYNAGPGQSITYSANAQFVQDSHQYTAMSYFDESNTIGTGWSSYPETLMMYDIYAMQQIYGANMTTRTGNTVYGFNSNAGVSAFDFTQNTSPAVCIWDAGGMDTLDCSGYNTTQTISLMDGTFSNVGGLTANVSIAYGAVIENAVGGGGADTITGNGANNTIDGGLGTNTVDGGAGRDIVNVNANSGTLVHNADGSWTVTYTGGSDRVTNVEGVHYANGITVSIRDVTRADFDSSNVSDVLWRNSVTGEVDTWLLNTSGQVVGGKAIGQVSSAWQYAGMGDFNGDGSADVLWRNTTTGEVDTWIVKNGSVTGGKAIGQVSSAWQRAGTGDFNGDGTTDILWRNTTTGEVDTWIMTNGSVTGGKAVGYVSSAWQFAGTGDFNGDGTSDALWRNTTTGEVDTWIMTNGSVTGGKAVGYVSSAWQFVGAVDVNSDGTSDALWRNTTTGEVDTWTITNGSVTGGKAIGYVSSAWQFAGTGDYNGDGTGDVLWRNTATGEVDTWIIKNGSVIGGGAIGTASATWIASPA
jgi:serralysin